uniref:Uncharacterized protein n=1 Tax=Arundo donax TaxID=35708 RepID=A0A0A9C8Z9_ARUDO
MAKCFATLSYKYIKSNIYDSVKLNLTFSRPSTILEIHGTSVLANF